MKKMRIGLTVFLVLAGVSAFAANSYQCEGVKGTSGKLSLSVSGPRLTVTGSYRLEEGKSHSVRCSGQKGNTVRDFTYYVVKKSPACPADTVRIPKQMNGGKGGLLALVDRTGGDSHDHSGYGYQYFYCKK